MYYNNIILTNASFICHSFGNIFVMQLHNAVAEMEKEKFNIRKKHTEDMQELLEDTNARLSKMEEDYLEQIKSTVSFL